MKKNLAAILSRQKKRLDIINLNIPNPPKGYVLVKLKYSGICHTQLNEINGILGKDKYLPHCMGHEGTGEVIKIGKDVKKSNGLQTSINLPSSTGFHIFRKLGVIGRGKWHFSAACQQTGC